MAPINVNTCVSERTAFLLLACYIRNVAKKHNEEEYDIDVSMQGGPQKVSRKILSIWTPNID